MTQGPLFPKSDAERYRIGYLKLKSALCDRATGLPTLPVLIDLLRSMLDQRHHVGVLHLSISDLEMVESIYGWQVFDRITERVAVALREALGHELPDGTLLALDRVAGDSFVAFIPEQKRNVEIEPAFLERVAQALCRRLENAFDHEDFLSLSPRLGFRVGRAVLAQSPFHRFERCVYAAVQQASSFNERRDRLRESSWGEELKRIIRDVAVEPVFQPVLELGSRDVVGWEAYARGPRDSVFETPRAMFALSSRVGSSVELDQLCCEESLKAFAPLSDGGRIFLNVLPASLDRGEWREGRLPALLQSLGIRPEDLVLDLCERAADEDPDSFVSSLARCRDEGFALALDNVGTGRSGQAFIEKLRPDYLKLDVSLVRGIHENFIKQEVLLSLVGIARKIGAQIIAQGIESESEAEVLARAGARYGQGYLFAVPAAAGSALRQKRSKSQGH